MITDEILCHEYEQVLLGNKTSVPPYYFKYGDDTSENYVYVIMRFAFEKYLKQTPEDIRDHFNKDIARQMKLDHLMKWLRFPDELDKETDYFYVATLLYPHQIKYNEKELILRTYNRILNGDLKKFPKEYFSGTRGALRACICFQYMLNQHYAFQNAKEMYSFFSTNSGYRALKKYRLISICSEIYDNKLDFLNESLPEEQQDEYWYHYYKFMECYNALKQNQLQIPDSNL